MLTKPGEATDTAPTASSSGIVEASFSAMPLGLMRMVRASLIGMLEAKSPCSAF